MKITNSLKNRCGIFLFYDRDGIVDDYIVYMLRDLRKSMSHLLVVCNGAPSDEGLKILKEESDDVLIRANSGFDVGGYREGLFYLGFKEAAKYDEIIMFNYTFFGGIYPFSEMFEKMSEMDLDFWGITKHHKVDYDPYNGRNRYGYLPEHIQSHFIVMRKSLFMSDDFKEFFISMNNPKSYIDSICDYESIFTKHFEDLGYKWDVYINTDRYERYAYCPVMFYIKDLFEEQRCPIMKRRSFFTDYKDFLINTCGESSIEAYDFIRENTDYDVNLIWDNILRVENMTEVSKAMHLNYCLPEEVEYVSQNLEDVSIVIWAKNISSLTFYEDYLAKIDGDFKVCIVGNDENARKLAEKIANNNIDYINVEPDSYQKFMKEAVKYIKNNENAKYIGVAVVDTVETIRPYSNVISNVYKDFNCLFASEQFISNIKTTFVENVNMGLLIPPVPDFGEYFAKYADPWEGKFESVLKFTEEIGIKANIRNNIAPMLPVAGNFWTTREMLLGQILEKSLENTIEDDIFLMALSSIIQSQKRYTGVAYGNNYAAIEITNSDHMMRELNKVVFDKYGANYHDVVLDRVKNNTLERDMIPELNWKDKVKGTAKKILPGDMYLKGKKVYFKMRGREFKD